MAYLKNWNTIYFGKLLELRGAIKNWLSYIPQTFPHYTRHTVEHSDEIVAQLSKLLFKDDDPSQPVVRLSSSEVYILGAAAYLHDSGMVVPDNQKTKILASDAWKTWTTGEGGGAKRWREIQALRAGQEPADDAVRYFLADIQIRFLIAEFVRLTHHQRAADVITQHQGMLGRFAFDDPILLKTIADVCVAHGLKQHELEDRERYPERRDVLGQQVNVRFLAILLRIGDLLDVSYDRACPLLLNAASPLPAESLAHWTQYRRISHRLTSPETIEITADCETQEEHRFLQDWFQWMVAEIHEAGTVMARATRHNDWQVPQASLDDVRGTIKIRPAASATYLPSKWTFELDHEAVFQRLISDVYDHPAAFVRELLQNAFDANRSKMYADFVKDGLKAPEYPNQVDEGRRYRYPVKVSLRTEEISNALSGEAEERQILTVEDFGIGMDREVIQRYFLQVGRSYYTTDEFRRSFSFVPTSRFGLGFLSVFAVSDQVTVETYKPESQNHDGPIRLTLTGPRNYLLTDHGERQRSGTVIEVLLREQMKPGELTTLVSSWCRRVEFPIFVDDLGTSSTVYCERPEQFTYELPVATKNGAKFAVRAFPTNRPQIDGELYVFALLDHRGESWADWYWANYSYPEEHPSASKPKFPGNLTCLHGISMGHHPNYSNGPMSARLDYRGESHHPTLSRERSRRRSIQRGNLDPEILGRWEEIINEHLVTSSRAKSQDGWKYKQRLVDYFPLQSFWASIPEMLRIQVEKEEKLVSFEELQAVPLLTTIIRLRKYVDLGTVYAEDPNETASVIPIWGDDTPAIIEDDLRFLSREHHKALFRSRYIESVQWLPGDNLALHWTSGKDDKILLGDEGRPLEVIDLDSPSTVGFTIHRTTGDVYDHAVLNASHPFTQWLVAVKSAFQKNAYGLREEQFDRLLDLVRTPVEHDGYELPKLVTYLNGWSKLPNLPKNFHPPTNLTTDMFIMKRG